MVRLSLYSEGSPYVNLVPRYSHYQHRKDLGETGFCCSYHRRC